MVPQELRSSLRQARSYAGLLTDSDHRLVVCKIDMKQLYIFWNSRIDTSRRRIDFKNLKSQAAAFQKHLSNYLTKAGLSSPVPAENLEILHDALESAAVDAVGVLRNAGKPSSDVVHELSVKQKAIRDQLRAAKEPSVIIRLREQRKQLLKEIHKRTKLAAIQSIDAQVASIDEHKDDARMFHAVQVLRSSIKARAVITDPAGKFVSCPSEKAEIAASFFHGQLSDSSRSSFSPFTGPPSPLSTPITVDEVEKAIKRMKNCKAPGPDEIRAELYKYSGRECASHIANILNDVFVKNMPIDTNTGVLCPLQKPGKAKGPCSNLRPVVLLNVVRKVLSIITLNRLSPKLDPFIGQYQSGFRHGRSTTEVVWCKRWLTSLVTLYALDIHITDIDLSHAFDTVDRSLLIQRLSRKPGVTEDDVRLVAYLLADTRLQVRIDNELSEAFTSNLGTPQGDGLSPFLFLFYLNEAIGDAEVSFPLREQSPAMDRDLQLPALSAYADDVDLYSTSKRFLEAKLTHYSAKFTEWNLKINADKTEHICVHKDLPKDTCPGCNKTCRMESIQCDSCDFWWHFGCTKLSQREIEALTLDKDSVFFCPNCHSGTPAPSAPWKSVKSLGSLLGNEEDVARRTLLAAAAFRQHYKIWPRRHYISLKTRLKIYNAFVMPVLTYNLAAAGLSKQLGERLDTFHRKQLRMVSGYIWPKVISNEALYKLTNSRPISSLARERRWTFFGHVCRLPPEAPARQVMHSFFLAGSLLPHRKGRPASCLYRVLAEDLNATFMRHRRLLNTHADLLSLETLAQNRERWSAFVRAVCASQF